MYLLAVQAVSPDVNTFYKKQNQSSNYSDNQHTWRYRCDWEMKHKIGVRELDGKFNPQHNAIQHASQKSRSNGLGISVLDVQSIFSKEDRQKLWGDLSQCISSTKQAEGFSNLGIYAAPPTRNYVDEHDKMISACIFTDTLNSVPHRLVVSGSNS